MIVDVRYDQKTSETIPFQINEFEESQTGQYMIKNLRLYLIVIILKGSDFF